MIEWTNADVAKAGWYVVAHMTRKTGWRLSMLYLCKGEEGYVRSKCIVETPAELGWEHPASCGEKEGLDGK